MKYTFTCLLAALLLVGAFAQQPSFKANFEVRRPNTHGAVVTGSITYDLTNTRYRLDFTGRQYAEIYKYSVNYGSDRRATINQWLYQIGQFCTTGCHASRIDYPFPWYSLTGNKWTPASAVMNFTQQNGSVFETCVAYAPAIGVYSNLTNAWFTSGGRICRATWNDGADYQFTGFTYPSLVNTTVFNEPVVCQCADAVDIILMIDRSASVSKKDYDEARRFARSFARTFNLSPAQTHLAIAHFHVTTKVIMELYEGTAVPNIDAAVNAMQCTCDPNPNLNPKTVLPENPDRNACCLQRTSVSAAIDFASGMFDRAGRPGSKRVVMFILDGRYNTMFDGTPCNSSAVCMADLDAARARFYAKQPNSVILGVGCGGDRDDDNIKHLCRDDKDNDREERHCNTSDIDDDSRSHIYITAAAGCSAPVYYCDPTQCDGLCECSECRAPSSCDPNSNFCAVNTLDTVAKVCEDVPRDCSNPNKCLPGTCNNTAGQCQTSPITCQPPANPTCFQTNCLSATGLCTTTLAPNAPSKGCADECTIGQPGACNDNNACTVDSCSYNGGSVAVCVYSGVNCDDGNVCTVDVCDVVNGCQHYPQPASFCDDHIDCTLDVCVPNVGCNHTDMQCNDGLSCTTDFCDHALGHCTYTPIDCPMSSDNCTLNYCLAGGCNSRYICTNGIVTEVFTPGVIAGIVIAGAVGVAGLGGSAFVMWKIFSAPKAHVSGGSAKDFAAE